MSYVMMCFLIREKATRLYGICRIIINVNVMLSLKTSLTSWREDHLALENDIAVSSLHANAGKFPCLTTAPFSPATSLTLNAAKKRARRRRAAKEKQKGKTEE